MQASARPSQQRQGQPFRANTRQRLQKAGTISLPTGAGGLGFSGSLLLPQVGLLSRIFLWVDVPIADATAETPVIAPFSPWNLLKRIQVVTNLGASSIDDVSGYGLYVVNKAMTKDYDATTPAVNAQGATTGITNDPEFQIGLNTAFGAGNIHNTRFILTIPVGANWGKNFALGLINLQAPEIRVNVNIQSGVTADIVTTGTGPFTIGAAGGTVNIYYEYYEIPPPSRNVVMPPLVIHRLLEDRQVILATGDFIYLLQRQGKLLRLFHTLSNNNLVLTGGGPTGTATGGAANNSVVGLDNLRLVFNNTDTVYSREYIVNRILQDIYYGHTEFLPGSYVWDLWCAEGHPGLGDFRDVIDTEAISTIQSIPTVNAGVTVTQPAYVDSVREIVQGFSVAAAGA